MEQGNRVNVWLDRPGNFLEVSWGRDAAEAVEPPGLKTPNTQLDIMVDVAAAGHIAGFAVIGALTYSGKGVDETIVMSAAQPHPFALKYNRQRDLWRAQWGPAVADCIPTPNPRIQALVDAAGQIQGVEIRDLRTFEGEILNQDLYPAELGVKAGQS